MRINELKKELALNEKICRRVKSKILFDNYFQYLTDNGVDIQKRNS